MPVQLNLIFASSPTAGNNHDTGSNVPVNRIVLDSENCKVIIAKHHCYQSSKLMIIPFFFFTKVT